ncbi:hypothetical protein FE782_07925 [Paenibacillus antri]|uniref:Uncharacterized protein n=1 Tax=Paenibacillus antri TaxID=2582848 RepID=A0A5R9GDY7_9BACL|nr:hypothetical protein [Paenibacillus antri]TLS52556.1 hypothetical protein FE782_07925 [Paenibacillus antri]
MNIHLTEQAYAAFAGREGTNANEQGREEVQARLQSCAEGDGFASVQWQGRPALYALDAYWRYEAQADIVALTDCVGVFHAVSVSRWDRSERQPERRLRNAAAAER